MLIPNLNFQLYHIIDGTCKHILRPVEFFYYSIISYLAGGDKLNSRGDNASPLVYTCIIHIYF